MVGWLHGEIHAKDARGETEIELTEFKQRNRYEECTHIYKYTLVYT